LLGRPSSQQKTRRRVRHRVAEAPKIQPSVTNAREAPAAISPATTHGAIRVLHANPGCQG